MNYTLVGYLLLFVAVGVGFILIHLLIGKLIRPAKPHREKLTIYECGEPTIGSAWVQFDLRFYVVALLFVIFDVEVAFFFPWAVVFGQANAVARADLSTVEGQDAYARHLEELAPPHLRSLAAEDGRRPREAAEVSAARKGAERNQERAREAAWVAFADILVFFGVLLVGFAYLWKRGDLAWVRSTAAERAAAPRPEPAVGALVGAGRG